jgi:hypothetical protein
MQLSKQVRRHIKECQSRGKHIRNLCHKGYKGHASNAPQVNKLQEGVKQAYNNKSKTAIPSNRGPTGRPATSGNINHRNVTSQKSKDLIYGGAEASDHAQQGPCLP